MPESPAAAATVTRTPPAPRTADRGTTLIELLVVMTIFAGLLSVIYSVLITVQRQTQDTVQRADAIDQTRLGLAEIDRQVRSGNVLYDSTSSPSELPLSMRVYTQANGDQRCVQWQVAGGLLRTRSWSTTWQTDADVSGWRTTARGLVNDASTQPFTLSGAGTAYGPRLMDVRLLVSPGPGRAPVEVGSSLSGRNTVYGYDPGVCNPPPPA